MTTYSIVLENHTARTRTPLSRDMSWVCTVSVPYPRPVRRAGFRPGSGPGGEHARSRIPLIRRVRMVGCCQRQGRSLVCGHRGRYRTAARSAEDEGATKPNVPRSLAAAARTHGGATRTYASMGP